MSQEEAIRILIVDDIPETRENLRKLLYFESDIEVVGAATSGQEGIDLSKELRPDIVLMDINMPGVDGITATKVIVQEVPAVQVIIMSVQGETSYMRSAMMAGARDFLTKPFTSDELISVIRRVYELGAAERERLPDISRPAAVPVVIGAAAPPPEGKIITFFSPKGGCGCSTLATNLAIALYEETKDKVALMDASFQFGDIGVLLNLQPIRTIDNLITQFDEFDGDLLSNYMVPHSSGVKILMAPPRPEMAERVTSEHVKAILEELKKSFDYVIVDTSTILQDMLLNIFDLSERIVLLMTLEIPAIKNVKLFFEVTEALGYPTEKTALVINKADRRSGIRAEKIEESIRHPVAAQIAMDERTAVLSVNQGVPFVLGNRNSYISQSVFDLARRLIQDLEIKETVAEPAAREEVREKPLGGLSRLFH
jgi:pilus assembly protein CpaE